MSSHSTLGSIMKRAKGDDPIRPLIDEYLIKRPFAKDRLRSIELEVIPRHRPGGRLSPSGAMGCKRQTAFKFLKVKGEHKVDPDKELIFDVGNWTHHMFHAMFLDMEKVLGKDKFQLLSTEAKSDIQEISMSGWLDHVVLIGGKTKYVVDLKTIRDNGFGFVCATNKPKPEHVNQIHCYMKANNIPKAIIIYINKDNQKIKSFVVKFDKEVWKCIRKWGLSVLKHLNNRTLPPMHEGCEKNNNIGRYCPWSSICYGTATKKEIKSSMYKEFVSIEESWQEGNDAVAKSD